MMRLYLIRHGETVDNVAGVYAGVKDSPLTNHGFHQAACLGEYLCANDVCFTHIFSSHLRRAYKTAELVRKGQLALPDVDVTKVPEVRRVPLLVEQDFGFYEGKRNIPRPDDGNKAGREDHYAQHRHLPGFKEPETKASMAERADKFLDEHLLPLLLAQDSESCSSNIAIVSHGLIMPVLWRRLLLRLPSKSVSIVPEVLATRRFYSLEHLGGWSNTGYLTLELKRTEPASTEDGAAKNAGSMSATPPAETRAVAKTVTSEPIRLAGWTLQVTAVNSTEHLHNLKRTGGGVGSARHDESQKSIESFFKRRKIG